MKGMKAKYVIVGIAISIFLLTIPVFADANGVASTKPLEYRRDVDLEPKYEPACKEFLSCLNSRQLAWFGMP